MTLFAYILIIVCVFQQSFSWHTIFHRDRPEEHLGCYVEQPLERVFNVAPGDYKVTDVSPIQCMVVCGQAYKYAALQNGVHCMCSNRLPTNKTADTNCPAICPGTLAWPVSETRPRCGGVNTISVYTIENRILGLTILDPGILKPFERTNIQASITNGRNIMFHFSLGDGDAAKPQVTAFPNISHVYDRPGFFKVVLTAKNNVSGSELAERWVTVSDPASNVTLSCPRATVVGNAVICNGSMSRGSNVHTVFDFGDGIEENLYLSALYGQVGPGIPSFQALEAEQRNTIFTIIVPSSEFDQAREITSVEVDAMSHGTFTFLVLRPTCTADEFYCHKKHSCIAKGSTCLSFFQHKCSSSEMFCIHCGRCLPNNDESLKKCNPDRQFHFTSAPADYQVVHEIKLPIPAAGHHFLSLEAKDKFSAKPGDILGWSKTLTNDCTLAYSKITENSDDAPEFEFSTASKVGDTLKRGKAIRKLTKHIFSAHFLQSSSFYLYHNYDKPGAYRLTSNISSTQLIYADLPITGVNFTCPDIVSTNHSRTIDIPHHAGTNTTYWWNLGNGDISYTQMSNFTYSYPVPGVYQMTMNAKNSLSDIKTVCSIKAFDRIASLEFVEPISAQSLGNNTRISWKISHGTNVTFTLHLGEGQPIMIFPHRKRNDPLQMSYEFKYNKTGRYKIMIVAENAVGPTSKINGLAIVEVPLRGIRFISRLPRVTKQIFIAMNDNVTLFVDFVAGTDPLCIYNFGDGTKTKNISDLTVYHVYSALGKHLPNVTCKNFVSSVSSVLNASLVVQHLEPIEDMQLITAPTAWKNSSIIMLKMTKGTTFFCHWDLGDGTRFKTDFSHFGLPVIHTYKSIADYYVNVTCGNRLGTKNVMKKIPVDIPIMGFNITCPAKFLKVNEKIELEAMVSAGSRMRYDYLLGDGTVQTFQEKSNTDAIIIKHAYTKPGIYRPTATVVNQYNKASKNCSREVKIEYPVDKITLFSNSPLTYDPGEVKYYLYKSQGFIPPTDAVISWDFGDGNTTDKMPIDLTNQGMVLKRYKYALPGMYKTKVLIANNVSSLSFELTIDVQKMVLTMLQARYADPITYQMVNGKGPKHNFYPLESDIHFSVTSQAKDQYYLFDFNYKSAMLNSSVPMVRHKFKMPGTYNVSCLVKNVLQTVKKYSLITMVESIQNVSITGPAARPLGENLTFVVKASQFGSHVCHTLDFGDGIVSVFNSTPCEALTSNKSNNYTYHTFQYPGSTLFANHTYAKKGFYTVQVKSKNMVSESLVSMKVEITYRPCGSPGAIIGGGGLASKPLSMLKSVELVLQANVSIDCDTAENVLFTWEAFRVAPNNLHDESVRVNLPSIKTTFKAKMPYKPNPTDLVSPTILEIPERTLPFGLIMIKLSLTFESSIDDLEDVLGFGKTWVDVKASPLAVNIKGGKGRAVGFELDHILDGTLTSDPDEPPSVGHTGMNFTWYCRREEEKDFPHDYKATDKKAGCFETGSYLLEPSITGFKFLQQNQIKAEIYTGSLKQFTTYILRLVVGKGDKMDHMDQSIKVLPGTPPTVDILCIVNCHRKLNSKQELKIESVCTDCKQNTQLFFLWSLHKVYTVVSADGRKIQQSTNVTTFKQSTTTGIDGANLAVKSGVFEAGQVYFLKVIAWKAGGNSSYGGFCEYKFTVNTPPIGGLCDVKPKEGFAIVTNFTFTCENWIDDDMPLLYQVDVRKNFHGANTVENLQNVYSGVSENVVTILPMGKETENFQVGVVIKVIDRYGATTMVDRTIKVKRPESFDGDKFAKSLDSLVGGDNIQAVAQRAVAAGSVLNKDSKDNGTSNFSSARNAILKTVSKVKACSVDQIKQMGGVFSDMTSKADELDASAKDSSSSAMSAMSECMLKANPQDSGLKSATLSLLQGSSNVMQAGQPGNGSENGTADSAAVNASSKVLDTIDKVGGSFMRQMVSGDKPMVVKTGNMDMQMAQVSDDANEDDLGFKLPKMESVNNVTSDGTKSSVGAMMTSSSKNPFGYGGGSDDLKSDVMGLTLTDAKGNPIDMAGQEIQMFVKRDLSKDIRPEVHTVEGLNMKVHKFNYTSLDSGIGIEIKPLDPKVIIQVWINYGKRPTSTLFLANYTLPTLEKAAKMKRLPDPYTYVMTNGGLNGTGEYYLGVKIPNRDKIYSDYGYVPSLNYTLRVFQAKCKMWDDTKLRWNTDGCLIGLKTTFNRTHCICKIPSETEEIVPTGTTTVATTAPTTTKGTSPVVTRKIRKVAKRVSFAGGFFVAPNPIDFSKAFAGFANLAENPVAFATVLAIFGVYLILLFWARREDRKDVERAGVTPLDENDVIDRQFYEVAVFTGFGNGAGTSSKVYIQLSGDEGETDPRELKDSNKKLFQARSQDMFLASFPDPVGELTYLRIWHDNSGKKPAWYLSRVLITDLNTNKKYLFINENRLAVEEGDGTVERLLPVAGPEEIASFNHLFYSTTQKNLTDGHLWFSIFIRPPKSRFTRVQRLSCCLTLLYCTMVANAMFYEVGGQTDPSKTIHVGPFAFSTAQIGIGIMSSLVIFPVNLIIVGIFRNIGPRPSPEEMRKRKSRPYWWLREIFFCCDSKGEKTEFMDIITSVSDKDDKAKRKARKKYDVMEELDLDGEELGLESGEIGFKLEKEEKQEEELKQKKKKKKKKYLPYWTKYFAWIILVLTSFTAAFFVVLYGFQFGKEKSAQWISSLMVSFVQDVCISQPIKILFLGLFIALVVKKPTEDEDEQENKKQMDEEYLFNNNDDDGGERRRAATRQQGIIRFQPPSKEKIKAARDLRLKELKMYNIVREIFIYFLFVISLCTVSYTHLDPRSFFYRKSLEDTFVNGAYGGKTSFSSIQTREDFWSWLNTTVVTGLFATHWYNDQPNIPGFTQDLYSNLFGGARIRQLRVKEHSCKVPKEAGNVVKDCNGWYSWGNEDLKQYDLGWTAVKNESLYNPPPYYKSWEYFTSSELGTYPFVGSMAAYDGGGYVGDLGKYPLKAHKLIAALEKSKWVDQRTRAVFLEVCVYNAQVNLFAIMNFITEFLPTNGIVHFHNIKIARLYTFGGSTESFTLACQFFVLLFLLVFIYKESKKIYKERKAYFKGFWNWVELIMIVIVLSTISIFFSRLLLINSAVKRIKDSSGSFVSFNKVATWDDLFTYTMSTLVLVACIKSIRLLQFNKTISILASTLKGSAKPLAAFSIVFLVFFLAYSILGFIIFVEKIDDFKTFVTGMESLMSLLLGNFDFHKMQNAQRIIAPIYFFTVVLFGVFYVLNVFLTIVMDTYADVKEDVSKQDNEYEIVDFMVGRLKKWVGLQGRSKDGADELMPESPKLKATKSVRRRRRNAKTQQGNVPKRFQLAERREELMKKFKQLDSSLNGLCVEDYAEDRFMDELLITGYKGENPFEAQNQLRDMDALREEAYYQQDLYEELNKWY